MIIKNDKNYDDDDKNCDDDDDDDHYDDDNDDMTNKPEHLLDKYSQLI